MNAFIFFIIMFIASLMLITLVAMRSKWMDKHYPKLIWGLWAIWIITMFVTIELIEDKTTICDMKMLESKSVLSNTFQVCCKERNGVNALLKIGDEDFYSFTTEDGWKYQIGVSNIIGETLENPKQVIIYRTDLYVGYPYFYLFKVKDKYLYELIE